MLSVPLWQIIEHNHYFYCCDAFRQEKQQSCQQKSFRISTKSTVNFRRHDPINTTPVFLAGDPFLTSRHQGEGKKPFSSSSAIYLLLWWSLVLRREKTDFYFILLMSQQDKGAFGRCGKRGRSLELWVWRTVLWLCLCPPPPSILEGAGWEWGRPGRAQEGGK